MTTIGEYEMIMHANIEGDLTLKKRLELLPNKESYFPVIGKIEESNGG